MTNYTKVPMKIITCGELTARQRIIMIYLYMRAGKKGSCYPSVKKIATETGTNTNTVIAAINVLEEKGFIKRTRRQRADGGNSTNLYTILFSAYQDSFPEKS